MVVARNYNEKKYVYYLLNKRETGFHFIIVPTNFTRNFVNFSLFVYKRICGYTGSPCARVRAVERCWAAGGHHASRKRYLTQVN